MNRTSSFPACDARTRLAARVGFLVGCGVGAAAAWLAPRLAARGWR